MTIVIDQRTPYALLGATVHHDHLRHKHVS